LLFFGIVYFGLFVYLELRVRKVKMLEQIAVIRGKIKTDEPAIADNFILITDLAQCPPYLRTGSSEWYTVIFLCLLWGFSAALALTGAYAYYLSWCTGTPLGLLTTQPHAVFLALLFSSSVAIIVGTGGFRRAALYAYYYDLKREHDHKVPPDYRLLEHGGATLTFVLRRIAAYEKQARLKNREKLMRGIEARQTASTRPDCFFCMITSRTQSGAEVIESGPSFILRRDRYPVSPGHLLIISRRHVESPFDLDSEEWNDLQTVLHRAKQIIEAEHKPDGYNIGVNVGAVSGQTVMHLHFHVIPRYRGDVPNPKGGIRNIIPGKGDY
jgi:diadenosine tetraphosphate (Ap4A) HIT family hydrolase